jgi:hypothetical protein
MWRSLDEMDDAALTRIMLARNKVGERVRQLAEVRHGRIPPSRTCYGDLGEVIVLRIDATLCGCHSKGCAAGNFKSGQGHHPLTAWCDNTGELLAIIARPGNAGSNTVADHIAIIDAALAAIPARWRHNTIDHHRWRGLERPWPPTARRSTKNPYKSSAYGFRGLPPAWPRLARMTNDSVPDLPLVRRGPERWMSSQTTERTSPVAALDAHSFAGRGFPSAHP